MMLRQIRQLSHVQLLNLFGINEIRHTKDKKKKARYVGLALVWLLLILMMLFYMTILSAALVQIGLAEIVPKYLFMITSLIILFFALFKAGSVIFQMNTYEMMVSLPVSQAAIVISRFLTMYVTNLLMSLIIILPGTVIYGALVKPQAYFYVYSILGILLLPLLPLSIATALGAGITAISSRMRHKSLVSAFLTVFLTLVFVVLSMRFSSGAEMIDEAMVINMAAAMEEQIGSAYPPAVWFGNAAVHGELGSFLLLAAVSVLVFAALVFVLQRFFQPVCAALNATSAKNNYKMQNLSASSPLKALWKREQKRYFASSIYVSNTLMGYLLMAVLAVALFLMGPEKIEEMLQLPGVVTKTVPLLLSFPAVIMPTTACTVSMEGKQWWIAQTLPVKSRDIWNAKVLWNITLALPFYLVSVVLGILAAKPGFVEGIWIVLVPLFYILFTSVMGITVNLAMPIFDWENETRVVKQSASVMVTMLVGMVSVLPPFVAVFLLGVEQQNVIFAGTVLVLLALTLLLYVHNRKKEVLL